VVSEWRPEQQPEADRILRNWGDAHRTEGVSMAARKMAYAAALFDSTPSADNLAALSDGIERVDNEITRFLALVDGLYVQIKDFQADVDKLIAKDVTARSGYEFLGILDQTDLFDRLAALYKLDHRPGGWRSKNGVGE
jgi:hypothetical protein